MGLAGQLDWLSLGRKSSRRNLRKAASTAYSYSRPLRVEPLESRWLLANVTVSNLNDVVNGSVTSIAALIATPGADGISLREAITAANADAVADTIGFSVTGTINLSSLGQLLISKSVTINGLGANLLTIRAYDPSAAVGNGRRVFEINDGVAALSNVTIGGVTITGGDLGADSVGAGIWNRGENLTLNNVTVTNNKTAHVGGGIGSSSSGTLTVNASTITGNSAGADTSLQGGGIYATTPLGGTLGNLVVTNSTVTGNTAGNGAGISALVAVSITGSQITNNTAVYYGGGIWAGENVSISNSTISGNKAATGGGGIEQYDGTLTMTGSVVSGNMATAAYSFGGGIDGDNLNISLSTISGNSAKAIGGGVYGTNVNISYSTVSGNSVSDAYSNGGGLAGGGMITGSTVSGNSSAGIGGGVSGNFDIINSTVSGNTAAVAGGGVYRSDFDTIVIRHSTVSGNTAPAGAGSGVASPAYIGAYRVQIQSSIIAGNTNSDVDLMNGTEGTIESLGYNLVGSGNAAGAFGASTNDKVGLNPLLGSLANNGGTTMTHALLVGSPAIDAGNPAAVAGSGTVPQFDQRRSPNSRVQGGRIDIGAFESTPIAPALLGDYNRDAIVDSADYVVWRKFDGAGGVPLYSGSDGSGNGSIGPEDYGVWANNFGRTGAGAGGVEVEVFDDYGAARSTTDEHHSTGGVDEFAQVNAEGFVAVTSRAGTIQSSREFHGTHLASSLVGRRYLNWLDAAVHESLFRTEVPSWFAFDERLFAGELDAVDEVFEALDLSTSHDGGEHPT